MNIRQPLITRLLLVAAALLAPASAIAYYGTESLPVPGYVFKQGLVLNEEGKPVFAEYDAETGNAVNILKDFDASDPDFRVISAVAYKSSREQLIAWRKELVAGEFEKFEFVTPAQFKRADYPEEFHAYFVEPYSSSRSLLVYKPEALDSTVALSSVSGIIVQQSVFDIRSLLNTAYPDTKHSLLIDKSGVVRHPSEHNIGFRVAFFNPDGSTLQDGERSDTNIYGQDLGEGADGIKNSILAPIEGARISNPFSPGFISGVSDKNGFFRNYAKMPICPGFSYNLSIPITAEVPYRSFNPQRAGTFNHYYFWNQYNYFCAGLPLDPPTNIGELLGYINAIGVLVTTTHPVQRVAIPVDVTLLTGSFSLSNPDGSAVPVGDSTVHLSTPRKPAEYVLPEKPDFNNDGADDHLSDLGSIPQPEGAPDDAPLLYGVWFSTPDTDKRNQNNVPLTDTLANGGEPIAPDLVRVAVQKQNFDDIGLLEAISFEDLANTDLYVFRQSTGQLVMEKSPFYPAGSSSAASGYGNGVNGIGAAGQGYFEVAIPGRDNQQDFRHINSSTDSLADALADPNNKGLKYNAWQATQFVAEDFRGETDSLRVGEPLQVVVINRATGYIGIADTAVEAVSQASGQSPLAIPLGDIFLQPPNLKISVVRQYEVELGLTQGQSRQYTVGSEGAALHSDQYVKVTTDWRAADGAPLPNRLPGYTGRLTSLKPDATFGKSSVDHFGIEPGINTELIELKKSSAMASTGYQYLHVVAEQDIESARFGTSDTTRNRPEKFVPVRVAVYDEKASRALKQSQLENLPISGEYTLKQDSSVYQWKYRPEMMYAVFDLNVSKITRTVAEGEEPVDITENRAPVIETEDLNLSVTLDILAAQYSPLELFGPDSELVYSLEGYQQQVNTGENITYSYTDFGHLSELNGEDFLTLNLINNQDAGNVLWEWAFVSMSAGVDLNRDGYITFGNSWYTDKSLQQSCEVLESDESAVPTDLTSPQRPYRFWLNNDYDVVETNDENEANPDYRIKLPELTDCGGIEGRATITGNTFEQVCELSDAWVRTASDTSNLTLDDVDNFRDFEDVAPIDLKFNTATFEKLKTGELKLRASTKTLGINLYSANWGGQGKAHRYQWDRAVADGYLNVPESDVFYANHRATRLAPGQPPMWVNPVVSNQGMDASTHTLHLIFEGRSGNAKVCTETPADCYVEFELLKDLDVIKRSRIYMDLRDVRDFYDQANAGDAEPDNWSREITEWPFIIDTYPGYAAWHYREVPFITATSSEESPMAYVPEGTQRHARTGLLECVAPESIRKRDYVTHVHGWNMTREDKHNFHATAFKRLYWSGYQGGFAAFSWPTGWFAQRVGSTAATAFAGNQNKNNYSGSEVAARRSGRVLANWLQTKKGDGEGQFENIHLAAHSMGNIVSSEALRFTNDPDLVTSYSASQSADAAGAYDSNIDDMLHEIKIPSGIFYQGPENQSPIDSWERYNIDAAFVDNEFPPDVYRWDNLLSETGIFLEDTDTPALRTRWGQGATPYYGKLNNKGSDFRMVSYFNIHDSATNTWEFGQLTKPEGPDGWRYQSSRACARVDSARFWLDSSSCDAVSDEGRVFHNNVRVPWPNGRDDAYDEVRFDVMARVIPARTRALGRINFRGDTMPQVKDGVPDDRLMRVSPVAGETPVIPDLMTTYELSEDATNSGFDHSIQYHGYMTEVRGSGEAFRGSYWRAFIDGSLEYRASDYSGLKIEAEQ